MTRLFIFFCLLSGLFSVQLVASERKSVLVISAYHPAFPTFYRQNLGVRQGLEEQGFHVKNMDLDYEFMDSKRFFDDTNLANFTQSLSYKLSQAARPYDVVLVADDNALDFALSQRDTLFKEIPVVFFGVNSVNKALLLEADTQFTGVVEGISIQETFDLIESIHGKDITLQVITDATPSGQSNLKSILSYDLSAKHFELEPLDLSSMSYQQLANALASNAGNAVIMLSGYKDVSGESKDFYQLADFVAQHSASPVYHFWRHGVGEGLFGGKVVSHHEQGRIAATMAGEILKGKTIADLPVMGKSPNVFMFDYTLLSQYDIPESAIPSNTQWINKPLSFREANPQMFWFLVGVLVLGALIIVGLLVLISVRRKVTRRLENDYEKKTNELEKTYSDLLQSEKMAALGRLVAGVAHEINTPVGVGVTTTSHLQALFEALEKDYNSGDLSKRKMESFISDCKEGSDILMSSLSGAAQLISSFKQVAVDQSNEHSRVVNLAEYLEAIALSLKPKLKLKGAEVRIFADRTLSIETYPGALSQVVTNLIINSLIHGFEGSTQENQIDILVSQSDQGAEITYKDNGKGMDEETCQKVFDPFFTTKMGQGGSGLGMNIVYNLVCKQLNGEITCESTPREGVQFRFSLTRLTSEASNYIPEQDTHLSQGRVLH